MITLAIGDGSEWNELKLYQTGLLRYGSQIDVSNTTTPHWRLYHLGSLQTLVALRPKFQSDLCCNLTVRKCDEHTKHPLGSLIQRFIRNYIS